MNHVYVLDYATGHSGTLIEAATWKYFYTQYPQSTLPRLNDPDKSRLKDAIEGLGKEPSEGGIRP